MKYDMEIAVSLPYPFLVVTPVGRSSREATVGSWERNEGKKSDEGTETEWEWRAKWGPGHSSSLPTPFGSLFVGSHSLHRSSDSREPNRRWGEREEERTTQERERWDPTDDLQGRKGPAWESFF